MGSLRDLRKRTSPPDPWDHIDLDQEIQVEMQYLLFESCRTGNLSQVRAQLDNGADVNQVRRSSDGRIETPLLAAIANKHSRVAMLLLKRGADPNIADQDQSLPLYDAAYYGMIAVTKALVRAGADVNAEHPLGFTPLAHAVCGSHGGSTLRKRYARVVQILTEAGAVQ
jgi:ankyrin repeat protein